MVATFVLHSERDRRFAIAAVVKARVGKNCDQVRISKPTRTLEQNGRLHAILTDIAKQLHWPPPPANDGELHDVEWWKRRCTLGWLIETKQPREVITPLDDSDEFALLLPHTSDLNVEQLAALCEWSYALGATNGVLFKEPRQPEPPPMEEPR